MRKGIVRASPSITPTALFESPPVQVNELQSPIISRKRRKPSATVGPSRFTALHPEEDVANRQAELFYFQKQIQLQTQMVFILEDGVKIQGVIEWYDRHSIKVRGKSRTLIYKSAIKYLYKSGEIGSAPEK